MILRLIMSVLGEASAGMRWAGTRPRMACSRTASMACCGVAASGIVRFVVLGIGSVSCYPST